VAYSYTVNDSVETDALLVRREQVLSGRSGIVDVVPGEGERVGAGQTVAMVYRDSAALERKERIRSLSMEAELLEYATTRGDQSAGSGELEQEVVRCAALLRSDTAAGDFGRLEDRVLDLKRAVLHRDYVYGQGVDASRLAALNAELSALKSRDEQETTRVYAGTSGVYSAQVDGFETLADPQSVFSLSVQQLDELLARPADTDTDALGKLITSNRWFLAMNLPREAAQRLSVGKTVTVRFSGDFEQDLSMRVDQVGKQEQEQVTVVLSTDRALADTTLLRRQSVELIFAQQEGLRVPKSSVHILTEDVVDKEGKLVEIISRTGVYAAVNNRAEFKEVEIVAEGSQFYVVRPLESEKTMLRAGDQVIVHGRGLTDGAVLSE
ncbi:MAG: hypothetical protein J6R39_04050, partial [Oscillospiraceae bacterium]|nr:hypothetical protein [Oscillospiraceae bacterium]